MKLNEIKNVYSGEYNLLEGVIPVHILMTLEQIISGGRITNSAQTTIVAGLVGMFKNGGPYRWPRELNSFEMGTDSNTIDAIKGLTDEEAVQLASWLYNRVQCLSDFEANPFPCHTSNHCTVDWIKWVLRRQD